MFWLVLLIVYKIGFEVTANSKNYINDQIWHRIFWTLLTNIVKSIILKYIFFFCCTSYCRADSEKTNQSYLVTIYHICENIFISQPCHRYHFGQKFQDCLFTFNCEFLSISDFRIRRLLFKFTAHFYLLADQAKKD